MAYPVNDKVFVTTDGQRLKYEFFDPNSPSNDYGYIAITCDPLCVGNASRHTIYEDNSNFTGYGGLCEISQKPFSFSKFFYRL